MSCVTIAVSKLTSHTSHINKSGKLVENNIVVALRHFQSNIFYFNLDTLNTMHRIHCASVFVYGFVLLMSEAIRCFVTLVTRVSKIIHTVLNKTVTGTEFFGRTWVYKRVFLT